MSPRKKLETKDYQRRAVEKYHKKLDRFTISLPKGEKEWILEHIGEGSLNQYFLSLHAEYKAKHGGDSPGVGSDSGDYPEM